MELKDKLHGFGYKADVIGSLLHGGKISVNEAYKQVKKAWKEVKAEYKSYKKLEDSQ